MEKMAIDVVTGFQTFNRTIQELKYRKTTVQDIADKAFNRTIQELKSISHLLFNILWKLLIAPLP